MANHPTPEQVRYKDTRQAAAYVGCTTAFLEKNRVTRLYQIPYVKLGKLVRYDTVDLDAYMASRKVCALLPE